MEYSEDDLLDIINGISGSGDETGSGQTETGSTNPDGSNIKPTDSPEITEIDKNDTAEPRIDTNDSDSIIVETSKTDLLNNLNDKFDDIDRMLDVSVVKTDDKYGMRHTVCHKLRNQAT